MRVVLDTNMLIAALISRGTSHTVYEHCVQQHTIIVSQFILDELQEKLIKKFKYSLERTIEAIVMLQSKMEIIVPEPLNTPVCRDPDDDNVLALALAGSCSWIITGDKDLLILQQYDNILIVDPSDFLRQDGAR